MNITLFYDFEPDGRKRPAWQSLEFGNDSIDWNEPSLYADVSRFRTCYVGDFDDDVIGCSILLEEMTSGRTSSEIGINLSAVKERLADNYDQINRFILQVCDVAQVNATAKSFLF